MEDGVGLTAPSRVGLILLVQHPLWHDAWLAVVIFTAESEVPWGYSVCCVSIQVIYVDPAADVLVERLDDPFDSQHQRPSAEHSHKTHFSWTLLPGFSGDFCSLVFENQ